MVRTGRHGLNTISQRYVGLHSSWCQMREISHCDRSIIQQKRWNSHVVTLRFIYARLTLELIIHLLFSKACQITTYFHLFQSQNRKKRPWKVQLSGWCYSLHLAFVGSLRELLLKVLWPTFFILISASMFLCFFQSLLAVISFVFWVSVFSFIAFPTF
jgi:hypothetical protein